MSYNYLPLDRKSISFQQVKNLLQFDQFISITFDAHEHILKSHDYLRRKIAESGNEFRVAGMEATPAPNAGVPSEVVKLMIMLKLKALGAGNSGVSIDTAKRLMDLYNKRIFPVVHSGGAASPLQQLVLFLQGSGTVCYQGYEADFKAIGDKLPFAPLSLTSFEIQSLAAGNQFVCAFALYTFTRVEQLLRMVNLVTSLSCSNLEQLGSSLFKRAAGMQPKPLFFQAKNIINRLPPDTDVLQWANHRFFYNYFVTNAAAYQVFLHAVDVFTREINAVSGDLLVFAEDDLVLTGDVNNPRLLSLTLQSVSMAIATISASSFRRIELIVSGETMSNYSEYEQAASSLIAEINEALSGHVDILKEDDKAAETCLSVTKTTEQLLALEWALGNQILSDRGFPVASPLLEKAIGEYESAISDPGSPGVLVDDALEFIKRYQA